MKFRLFSLCLVILAASPVVARKNTDIILMKNGDRITCEIKGLRSDTLYISVPYVLGTLSLDWSKVDHIESDQLFLVKTQDGVVYRGALSTPTASGQRPTEIEVSGDPENQVTLDRTNVTSMTQTSEQFWQRFNGHIGTGLNYSKGNQSTQYNLNSDVNYPRDRWSAAASYNANLTSNTGSSTSQRNEVRLSAQRLMRWNNWYYTGLADLLQSSVQGIKLQNSFGAGIGRNLEDTGSTFLTVYGGFAWQKIVYDQSILKVPSENVSSGLFGTRLRVFRFDRTTLTVNADFLPAISDPSRMHLILNSSYYVKLWGKVDWNLSFYSTFDNRPPPGFAKSDYGTSSGIGLSFGNH